MTRKIIIFLTFFLLSSCDHKEQETLKSPTFLVSAPTIESDPTTAPKEGKTTGNVRIIGGDETSLRYFVERWFAPLYPTDSPTGNTTIWIGEFPGEFSGTLPLLKDSRVIASVQDLSSTLQAIADIPSSPEAFLATYSLSLENNGWYPAPTPAQGGGFVSEFEPWLTYCNEQQQAALTIQAFQNPRGGTEVRLNLFAENSYSMCDPNHNQNMDPAYKVLPVLRMPSGAFMKGGGSSSGGGTAESSSDIRTEISLGDLMAYFSSQLQDAEWQILDSGEENSLAWSSWLMAAEEDEWRGTLILLNDPVIEDLVYAMVRVVRVVE